MVRMLSHESNQCLLQSVNVVRLHPRILGLLTKWTDNCRPAGVAVEKAPHPHNLTSVNERVGDRLWLWLLNPLGESLSKCVHGDVRVVRPNDKAHRPPR